MNVTHDTNHLQAPSASSWTAFMYRRPEVQRAELGLGWRLGRLVVWLFGTEWTTPPVDLRPTRWHSVCLTWSHAKDRPALYIDGSLMDITPDFTSSSSSCCKLAPNGTLTLGAAHKLVNGNIQILPKTGLSGRISLFRLWGRERSEQDVTSLNCAEGDLVTWERDAWDTRTCAPLTDSTLRCGEPVICCYCDVRLGFYSSLNGSRLFCQNGPSTESD